MRDLKTLLDSISNSNVSENSQRYDSLEVRKITSNSISGRELMWVDRMIQEAEGINNLFVTAGTQYFKGNTFLKLLQNRGWDVQRIDTFSKEGIKEFMQKVVIKSLN